ncbi:MAG: polyphosphate kinase 2 family protein [Hyphomicrobiaceae bacterium]
MVDENVQIDDFAITPNLRVRLGDLETAWQGPPKYAELSDKQLKKHAKKFIEDQVEELADVQERLYASDQYSVLLIFQGRDAAGKDGTIKHVMSGVNPQGCQVFSFKAPSKEELDHNYLWRCWKALPERGRIGIFNRSYYEEVLVVRVHPQILSAQRIPQHLLTDDIWQQRYQDINAFERHLSRNGTVILKFFLNVSYDEQRQRFLERLEDPSKHWKFSDRDLHERQYWDQYTVAIEEMLSATSTPWAPWYVMPADDKWPMRALVGHIITERLERLELKRPEVSPEKRTLFTDAIKQLKND